MALESLCFLEKSAIKFSSVLRKSQYTFSAAPWRFSSAYLCQLSTDGRQFLLGTASDDLGVLCADSKAGGALQPISASLMRCSLTGKLERRCVLYARGSLFARVVCRQFLVTLWMRFT